MNVLVTGAFQLNSGERDSWKLPGTRSSFMVTNAPR